ncbi:gliding motility-associated C-terminal domain-containing protein [Taibaiella soli]|uniref:Gliding motility-associated C-terminal domain-containing protein n=1 Tax=Taibaiella soli TaxID=1649169 RepID=A0A2W2A9L2_9BACT|nr:gliding motility-associated C-terminal domain-containing protein [Taibaiella soli]PZF72065.1 hypothetical protein DN068_14090 [Taibaiella soli]
MAMLRLFVIISFMLISVAESNAQNIVNGDGTPFATKYCWENKNYPITGMPGGGSFTGCGVFEDNGTWYFNPAIASQATTIFPYQCFISYMVNNTTVNLPILVAKPVVVTPALQDTATCNGDFYLHATMAYAGDYDYTWLPSAVVSQPHSPNTTGHVDQTTTFVLMATDRASGCTGYDTMKVVHEPAPTLKVSNDTTIFPGDHAQLSVSGAKTYVWSPVQWLDDPFSVTPVATPHDATTYTVKGTDEYGCSATAQVHVSLFESMFLPNAFTPNGDGNNDKFKMVNIGYNRIQEFRVFNRWGQQLFYAVGNTDGWDGTFNGKPQESDTYYYILLIGMTDGSQKTLKGDVTLIR